MVESDQPSRHALPGSSHLDETFDVKFVDREEYLRLAISNNILRRWDDTENGIRSLFDPATGIRYAIAEGNLFRNN